MQIKCISDVSGCRFACRAHYAGTYSSGEAQRSRQPLWSSEDYSTVNNETGGGCMARVGGGLTGQPAGGKRNGRAAGWLNV